MADAADRYRDDAAECPEHGYTRVMSELVYTRPVGGCGYAATLACGCTDVDKSNDAQPGDRVRLVRTTDPHTTLQPGALGTVRSIDGTGTIHIKWDDGRQLGLVPEAGDVFEVVGHV